MQLSRTITRKPIRQTALAHLIVRRMDQRRSRANFAAAGLLADGAGARIGEFAPRVLTIIFLLCLAGVCSALARMPVFVVVSGDQLGSGKHFIWIERSLLLPTKHLR